eukprot:264747_1
MNVYDNINYILSIIDDVDLNNDGTIDYQEFLRALHPDFNQAPKGAFSSEQKDNDSSSESVEPDNEPVIPVPKKPLSIKPNNNILKEGWMQKEGKIIRSWKLRYFKLYKNGKMKYYHDENEEYAIATFNVKKLTKLKNKSWSNSNKKRYGIKVYTPHRNWKFLLINNDQRSAWMKAFEAVSGKKADNKATK